MPSLLKDKAGQSFLVASSPHLHAGYSVPKILWGSVFAFLPVLIGSLVFFGWDGVRILFLAVGSAIGFEWLFRTFIGEKSQVQNGSTVLFGVLFAFLMPPMVPWPLILFGSFVAVVIGKEMFGGLGQYLFHPALVGYATLFALFPYEMTRYGSPVLGGRSIVAILTSGVILIAKERIPWQMPFLYLATFGIGSWIIGRAPVSELLQGSIFLGAFLFITDLVTTPVTQGGRSLFAIGSGILTVSVRTWADYSSAMAFSILLANALVPLLDRFIRPRSRGIW